jgi:hypothetical protein
VDGSQVAEQAELDEVIAASAGAELGPRPILELPSRDGPVGIRLVAGAPATPAVWMNRSRCLPARRVHRQLHATGDVRSVGMTAIV